MTDPIQPQLVPGIEGYPGPYEVGRYAHSLRERVREFAHVALIGEVVSFRAGRAAANVYFELRDSGGALPCSMWRADFDKLGLDAGEMRDGLQVVVAGGCDYYPGSAKSSPSFSFRVTKLKPAGEGDLLAKLGELRRRMHAEGLFEPQKSLHRPLVPKRIGVVTAEGSAARRDFLAGLERRGWAGQIVWGYAPVQDRKAAPAIARALRDLVAYADVEAIVVTRGGGSIADLWAFCDEALCRTVALLPVPVISAVGHEVDRTLIDDVAAVSCSTPTHAAETAVRVHLGEERARLLAAARRADACGRAAVVQRAQRLRAQSRAPREHLDRHRLQLHQKTRELRAATRRKVADELERQRRRGLVVLPRKAEAAVVAVGRDRTGLARSAARLDRLAAALAEREAKALLRREAALRTLDPDRTLERGYALVLDEHGEPLTDAEAVRAAREFDLKLAGGSVPARVRDSTT